MGNKVLLVFLLMILGFSSCKSALAPEEYKNWIESEESGLHKSKVIGDFKYDLQFMTPEYKLLLNNGPQDFNKIDLERELAEYKDDYSFELILTNLKGFVPLRYNLVNESEYYGRIQYFNSEIVDDLFLLDENLDTLNCKFAHLERDFGISPELRLQTSFGELNEWQDIQFCYDDKMFQNGMIKFKIEGANLYDLPELKKG